MKNFYKKHKVIIMTVVIGYAVAYVLATSDLLNGLGTVELPVVYLLDNFSNNMSLIFGG